MARTRVKICGITRVEDAQLAVDAGADAIGLVFYPPSPRAVTIDQAQLICRAIPAFVSVVALTVDATDTQVRQLLSELPVSMLQFHGSEPAAFCEQFAKPYLKAVRMKPGVDLTHICDQYTSAASLLVDSYKAGVPGGTGEIFDWALIQQDLASRLVLAGGLNASNVQTAIQALRPYAVDVSGGVESSAGKKDSQKVREFIQRVNQADLWSGSSEK